MQEEQTVSFSPMYVDGPVPWFERLFMLYLLLVSLTTIIRFVRLAWALRKHRKEPKAASLSGLDSQGFWDDCRNRCQSLRNTCILTFLLTTLVTGWSASNILTQVTVQRAAGLGAVAGAMSETLAIFSNGIIVCTIIFTVAIFLERLVQLQRNRLQSRKGRAAWTI